MAQVFKLENDVEIEIDTDNTVWPLEMLFQASQAASLKRIADSLQNPYFGHGLVEQLSIWRRQDGR